eukprot:575708-Pelagomonas_calceolata.AAC.7
MPSKLSYSECGQTQRLPGFQFASDLPGRCAHALSASDQSASPQFFLLQWIRFDPKPTEKPTNGTNLGQCRDFGTHLSVNGQRWPKMPQKLP